MNVTEKNNRVTIPESTPYNGQHTFAITGHSHQSAPITGHTHALPTYGGHCHNVEWFEAWHHHSIAQQIAKEKEA